MYAISVGGMRVEKEALRIPAEIIGRRYQNESNRFKWYFPKGFWGILLVSVLSIMLFLAYNSLLVFPAFARLLAHYSENECASVADHVRNGLLSESFGKERLSKSFAPSSFATEDKRMRKSFGVLKIMIISASGRILYSSDPADEGRWISNGFFYKTVAKGGVFKKYVPKNALLPGGFRAGTDLTVAYVPISKGGRFLGASAVYMGVREIKTEADRLFLKTFLILFLLIAGLLAALLMAFVKAGKYQVAGKKAEEALERNEYLLRTIVETEPECVKLVGRDGALLMMNAAGLGMLQAGSFDEVGGKSVLELTDPADRDALERLVKNVFDGRPGSLEFRINGLKGRSLWLETNAVPLANDAGEITAMLGITRDVTGRKRGFEWMQKSLLEKETLLRELYHRTKNNMQVISSLISLQASSIADDRILQMFDDTKNRIQAMALVHEKLYQSKNLSSVSMKGYVEDLAGALVKSFIKGTRDISLKLDIADVPVPIDIVIPCGLIINELVSNSLKYAFPAGWLEKTGQETGQAAEIRISFRVAGGEMELAYGDNGIGLAGIDLQSVTSLGLKLVKNLAIKQLGGEMETVPGTGASFRIRFRG